MPTLSKLRPARPSPESAAQESGHELLRAGDDGDVQPTRQDGEAYAATPLFRAEVLAERQSQWLGTVLLEPNASHRTFTLVAVVAVAGIVALFLFRDAVRTARISGWLVPDAGLVRVFAPRDGVVAELHVKEGAAVRKGDRLLTLSGEVKSSAIGSTQAEVARLLAARRQMLVDQRARIQSLLVQQQKELSSRLAAIRSEQGPIEQEIALQKSRLELARRSETRQRDLLRQGFVSSQNLQQWEEARLSQAGRLVSLERERIAATRDQLALESELNDLPFKAQAEISAVEREIAAIEQQLAEAEAQREIVLVAPQDGRVTAILAEPGGHAKTSAPLLTIVPEGSRLEAHLYGPSRTVGFVRPGQQVFLRYQAYPYEKFGHYTGTVAHVSASPINPGELPFAGAGQPPGSSAEPVYRITVSLADQAVTAYGRPIPLQPGMQLEADVALDKRRLFEWMLDPLYAITGRTGP